MGSQSVRVRFPATARRSRRTHDAGADGNFSRRPSVPGGLQRLAHPGCINLCLRTLKHHSNLSSNSRSLTIGTRLRTVKRALFGALSDFQLRTFSALPLSAEQPHRIIEVTSERMLLSSFEMERPSSSPSRRRHPALQSMTTETYKRGTGALSAERGTADCGPLPRPIPLATRRAAPTPAAQMRQMSPAEFNTAMIHFYRGEIQRSNTWRNRLDTTTNWAVLTAGATLSFALQFSEQSAFRDSD